jgi:hypothetical protein
MQTSRLNVFSRRSRVRDHSHAQIQSRRVQVPQARVTCTQVMTANTRPITQREP